MPPKETEPKLNISGGFPLSIYRPSPFTVRLSELYQFRIGNDDNNNHHNDDHNNVDKIKLVETRVLNLSNFVLFVIVIKTNAANAEKSERMF